METEELLLKGGKNGKLWDSTAADLGLLLRRIHLPVEQKKHAYEYLHTNLVSNYLQYQTQGTDAHQKKSA